jgi:hypothetical protein
MPISRYYSFCLLLLHAALLLFLGFYFLAREEHLLFSMRQQLPLQFMLRFSAFWFISFVFTLLVFLLHIQHFQVQIPEVERSLAVQVGKYAFSLGAGAAVIAALFLYIVSV